MEIIVWILAGLVMVMVAGGFTMCRRWKKTAEAALTGRTVKIGAARDFSEALIANTPDGFVVVDEQMTIVQVNEAFCRITGRSPEELVGRRPPYPGWAPEEEGAIREHFGNVVHGEYAPIELTHIRKDGTRVPLLMNPGSLETANGDKFFFAVAKDLTEIKKTEDELRESEAKFRRIAETSTDAIYLLDLEGTITYISPVVKDILGYTQEEFVGRNFGVHFAGDDLVHAQEAFEKNLGGEDVRNIELRILNKKKEPVFLEMNATPIRKDDRIVGVQGMARDITERKLAEVALRDSDVKFKAQYKGLPIPVYTWQKQGDDFVLIDFNNAAEEITEGKIKDLVGMKAGQFFADDPDIPDELWRAFEEERFFQRELPYRFRSTGATKTLRVSYGYAPPDLVIVHTEDVTARAEAEERLRESEARFRAAVESIPFDLFVVGEDGRYTMQNSVCKEHWGDLIGKRPEDVDADAETLATWLSNNERALSGEIVEGDVSFKVGGEEKVFHNVISPIYDGDHMRGVLGVNIEITKRVCAEEALRKSEERLSGIISSTPNVAVEGYDAAGRILIWNPAAEKIFGWSAEEAVGKTLDQLILSEEDAAGFV